MYSLFLLDTDKEGTKICKKLLVCTSIIYKKNTVNFFSPFSRLPIYISSIEQLQNCLYTGICNWDTLQASSWCESCYSKILIYFLTDLFQRDSDVYSCTNRGEIARSRNTVANVNDASPLLVSLITCAPLSRNAVSTYQISCNYILSFTWKIPEDGHALQ